MRPAQLIIVFNIALIITACGGSNSGGENSNQEEEDTGSTSLVYDSELSAEETEALDTSTAALGTLAIDGSKINGFSSVFGGNSSSDVVTYFDNRANYALSSSTDITSRISTSLFAAEIIAMNVGTALWIGSAVEEIGTLGFAINDKIVDISSSRVGIMQFGLFFSQLHPVQQVNTLIHEARHSDCTGGLKSEDLESWRANQVPENKACGQVHEVCPPEHPYAGELACDSHPWGAYAVGAIHSLAVSESCDTCSEQDKTIAEQEALDSLSRLLYKPEDLLEGRLGPPNMSSSNSVEN